MADDDRWFPSAPLLRDAGGTARCHDCKVTILFRHGETPRQRCNPRDLGDRRACPCGRLQVEGAPGWRAEEEIRRRLGC